MFHFSFKFNFALFTYTLGKVSILAGGEWGYLDAKGSNAKFGSIWGLCFDEVDQALLVCDNSNSKIRKVSVSGIVLFSWEVRR